MYMNIDIVRQSNVDFLSLVRQTRDFHPLFSANLCQHLPPAISTLNYMSVYMQFTDLIFFQQKKIKSSYK